MRAAKPGAVFCLFVVALRAGVPLVPVAAGVREGNRFIIGKLPDATGASAVSDGRMQDAPDPSAGPLDNTAERASKKADFAL